MNLGTEKSREAAVAISVIIPAYNCGKHLADAIESVFAQTCTDYEVIVVNDGSTDNTEAVVRSYGDRIRYIVQDNAGPGAARNSGLAAARGRYVAFLDADDLWMPEKLATQFAFIESHPNVVLTAVSFDNLVNGVIDPKPQWTVPTQAQWWIAPRVFEAYSRGYAPSTPTVLVRTEALRAVGGFPTDVSYGEDVITWFRVGMRSGWAFCNTVLSRVRRQPQSLTKQRGFDTRESETLFDRLWELAIQQGTEDDLKAWRVILYNALMMYAKRAILSRRVLDAWHFLARRRSDLNRRHLVMVALLLVCAFPLRTGYALLRSKRDGAHEPVVAE